MKKKILITCILCTAAAVFLLLSLRSYRIVEEKMNLQYKGQYTMALKEAPETGKETETTVETDVRDTLPAGTEAVPAETETSKETEDPQIPVLTLVSDTVEIKVGDSFDIFAQVKDVTDDKDERSILYRDIQIRGNYSVTVPGEYILQYSVLDTDGNESKIKELKLIVNE